jgi:hypothetical protein
MVLDEVIGREGVSALLPDYPVLFLQVVDRVFLPAVEPARRSQDEEL